MKIIADSGSTKCAWLLTDGVHTSEYRTRGINAVQHSPEQIREALAELPPCGPVEAVYFYGAGCGGTFPEATEKMVRELRAHFGTGRIEAETDLLGAARALFGRGEGVACILGTGSNSCWCRGGEIVENVPPLGYVWRTQEDWTCVDATLSPDKASSEINSARQLHSRAEPYAFTVVTQGGKTCYIWAWRSLNKQ